MMYLLCRHNIIIILIVFLSACSSNDIYNRYVEIAPKGWSVDNVAIYEFDIPDSTVQYNAYVNVRHGGDYLYKNLWLFLEQLSPDSVLIRDTLECYLADNEGKWLGDGSGSVLHLSMPYRMDARFDRTGTYQLNIRHGMSDPVLTGIQHIGIRLERKDK